MFFIERLFFILIGLALVCAALLGAALYYHFSRFSPDPAISTATLGVYSAGVALIAIFAFGIMIFG